MIAYKLLSKRKDGSLGPLFINRRKRLVLDQGYPAESHQTKGYAFRPGWHCCRTRSAPHLSDKDRVWAKVEIENYTSLPRPASQGGSWLLAQHLKILNIYE